MSSALKKAARLLCYLGRHDEAIYLWKGKGMAGQTQCTRCSLITVTVQTTIYTAEELRARDG